MEQPLVSVVVPAYNAAGFLPKCLDSILAQSRKDLEVIVVDDGSTDSSAEICRQYQLSDSRVVLFSQENRGVSAARNKAISNAHGKYITFVDADDWIDKNHLASLVEALESTEADCAICGYTIEYPRKTQKRELPWQELLTGEAAAERMMAPELFQGFLCNKLFRTEIISKYRLMLAEDLTHYEDMLFCAEYFMFCERVCVTTGTSYHYRQRADSAMGHKKLDERWLSGRMSAIRAIERVEALCPSERVKAMCRARSRMELADMFRRLTAADGRSSKTRPLLKKVRNGVVDVLAAPLKAKYKVKYLSTALFPVCASRFWVHREDSAAAETEEQTH